MATKRKAKLEYVVVRTYSAGVHVGYLVSHKGPEVVLKDARRIWRWEGARTLNEIANGGVGPGSKVSDATARVTLTGAIEILLTTAGGKKNLESAQWKA